MSLPLAKTHVRIARPTNDFDAIRQFYIDGLGLKALYEFHDHDLFDGLIIGLPSAGYHLEFTRKHGHDSGRAPTEDNLTVFYLSDKAEWEAAVQRMADAGHQPVPSFNPYWDRAGKTFEDPDGYRIVLQNAGWENPDV